MPKRGNRKQAATSPFPRGRRLAVEHLEDRRMLAITVSTTIDELDGSITDGDISLRDAIALAAPGETIDFDLGTGSQTIQMNLGSIGINSDVTIDADPNITIILPNVGSRVFEIVSADVVINNLRFVALSGPAFAGNGGAVSVSLGSLTLNNNDFIGFDASGDGGAIFSSASNLEVTNGFFRSNTAGRDGGAIYVSGGDLNVENTTFGVPDDVPLTSNAAGRDGGAIATAAGVTGAINNSVFQNNFSSVDGGALELNASESGFTVSFSAFRGNSAGDDGGGIIIGSSGSVEIHSSTIVDNTSGVTNSAGDGGGIATNSPNLLIGDTVISGNSGRRGGGFNQFGGATTIVDTTISSNSAEFGGGVNVDNASLTINGPLLVETGRILMAGASAAILTSPPKKPASSVAPSAAISLPLTKAIKVLAEESSMPMAVLL